jgi:hypothetical protein
MPFRKIFFFILFSLVFSSSAHAFDGYVQQFDGERTIAWGSGDIIVTGEVETPDGDEFEPPTPLVVRKAASRARKLMLDMIMAIRIDGRQTVSAHLSDNEDLAAQLRGLVHNSLFEGPDMFRDIRSVKVSESLRGKLAELILPKTVQFQSSIPPRLSTATGPAFQIEETPEAVGNAGGFTGVIVDARGLKITPCLLPVIYGEDGLGAYGAFLVARADAVDGGVAAYATTANPAALVERVGSHPLVVRAVRTYGSWQTDLIIPTQAATLVRTVMQSGHARKVGVVIVVSPPPAPEKSAVKGGDPDA